MCPKCGNPVHCGCKACRRKHKDEVEWLKFAGICDDGELSRCPTCGFTAHLDQWLDIEFDQATLRKLIDWSDKK